MAALRLRSPAKLAEALELRARRKHLLELFGRQRLAAKIALPFVAAYKTQEAQLLFGLDAFGYDLEPEIMRQCNDCHDQRRVVRVCRHVAHERLVNLEHVY